MKTNVSSALMVGQTEFLEADREALRYAFLDRQGLAAAPLTPLPVDASKRCYFRLPNMLLMDAPPPHENTVTFHVMAEFLRDAGLNVPRIYASDHESGFLLVEDFGELTFRKAIENGFSESMLYGEVIHSLSHLHQKVNTNGIIRSPHKGQPTPESQETRLDFSPPFAMTDLATYRLDLFLSEAELFIDWYGLPLSSQAKADFRGLWTEAYHQQPAIPHSIILRDVMVDNLLWLPSQTGFKRCGFIDFQDGVWGPITYDLVSLLEDGRRDITSPFGQEMVGLYLNAFPTLDIQDFWASYNLWGAQRCTKILGIFSRLAKRDGKSQYLIHLPRVKEIIARDLSHTSLKALQQWFQAVAL